MDNKHFDRGKNKYKRFGFTERLCIITWNFRDLNSKGRDLENEIVRVNVKICVITETN